MKHRLYNSFAYRFNKWTRKLNLKFSVKLNNQELIVPVINRLGESNINLKEEWFFKLIQSLKLPEETDFLDIGANVGQSLLAFRSCYNNPYWGFEPNPACVYYLEHLVRINGFSKINILPVGLSSSNSLVKLYARTEYDSAATILSELKPGIFQARDAKYVPVFAFDHLHLDINKISLIKIDVEGAELNVISGMLETLKTHLPIIVCEILDYTSPESREEEQRRASRLQELLFALGYRMYRILHKNRNKLAFEPIEQIELIKWVPESYDLNDYLFLPGHITSLPEQH